MPRPIELIAIGNDSYSVLETSAKRLNAVQQEFLFYPAQPSNRLEGIQFSRSSYTSDEVFAFLEEFRKRHGGYRPYLIAFVAQPLQGRKLANVFGVHRGASGMAVVTLHGSEQYVREKARFCCYYMTRYAMSFINPAITSHNDPGREECYFHGKLAKRELVLSMDSGKLCDECSSQLRSVNPSQEEIHALQSMRQLVSGDLPVALLMKGGGVKGLAFAAALKELEPHYWFDMHVGTSAGAIAAILLAAGFTPSELEETLKKKDFKEFMDATWLRVPLNLLLSRGMFPGNHFLEWMESLIRSKFSERVGSIQLQHLDHVLLFASQAGAGTIEFDSKGTRRDEDAAFAARCSMSIPFFFVPAQLSGRRTYDGGLRNNFPLASFRKRYGQKPFIALYLRTAGKRSWMPTELLDIVVEGDERGFVDDNLADVVQIDPSPIGTTDFDLSPLEKRYLLAVGRSAALSFLLSRQLDAGPTPAEASRAAEYAVALRQQVVSARRWRRLWNALKLVLLAIVIAFLAWAWRQASR